MKLSNDSHVIVTGAASGMGAAVATLLANSGSKVSLFDLNQEAVKQKADQLHGRGFVCDVSLEASVEQAFAASIECYGNPVVVVNCAGIAPAKRMVGRDGPMPLDAFKHVIDINLVGTFNVMRLAANSMINNPEQESGERGVIINTASVAAFEGQIGQTAYSASKGGVVAMTLPAAREMAKFGVRINTIAPGLVATPMLLNMPQEVQDSLSATVPFPARLAKPEEFASLVEHIVSNQMINGEVIRLDGAIRMQAK